MHQSLSPERAQDRDPDGQRRHAMRGPVSVDVSKWRPSAGFDVQLKGKQTGISPNRLGLDPNQAGSRPYMACLIMP